MAKDYGGIGDGLTDLPLTVHPGMTFYAPSLGFTSLNRNRRAQAILRVYDQTHERSTASTRTAAGASSGQRGAIFRFSIFPAPGKPKSYSQVTGAWWCLGRSGKHGRRIAAACFALCQQTLTGVLARWITPVVNAGGPAIEYVYKKKIAVNRSDCAFERDR